MQQLPIPPPRDFDRAWAGRLVTDLQNALDSLSTAVPVGITVTGGTHATTFNASTATTAQIASALGQLIQALQKAGVIT